MLKTKWINYAVAILKAIHGGTGSIKAIASDCGIPPAYTAKVVAALRKKGIINKNYEFLIEPDRLLVERLLDVDKSIKGPAAKLRDIILFNLQNYTIDQIW